MYLFFDLGSTLINESLCDRQIVLDTVAGSAITVEEYEDKLREYAGRNMTNDLMRNYHTRPVELAKHLNKLLNVVCGLHPIIFYLYSDDVEKRITEARIARKQPPLEKRSIQFWKERAAVDQVVLPMLQVETHWMDISKGQWDARLFEILDQIRAK